MITKKSQPFTPAYPWGTRTGTAAKKTWKDEYAKLTAERKALNQRYLALKEEVKEAEKIGKSVYVDFY